MPRLDIETIRRLIHQRQGFIGSNQSTVQRIRRCCQPRQYGVFRSGTGLHGPCAGVVERAEGLDQPLRQLVAAYGSARLADILQRPLTGAQQGALRRQRCLFIRLRIETVQFLQTQTQGFQFRLVGTGAFHQVAVFVADGFQRLPAFGDLRQFGTDRTIIIQHSQMRTGIEQADRFVLAVHFQQAVTQRLENGHTNRLIIDKGLGTAIARHHTAQHQGLAGFQRQALVFEEIIQRMRG